jgi:GNAT superfamily N-acetyltransferase
MKLAFRSSWRPLRETMVFERLFHPNLRMTLAEKRELLEVRGAIAAWMVNAISGSLIGEVYGVPVAEALRDLDEGTPDLKPYRGRRAMYVYSTAILARYQRQGLGRILKAHHLGRIGQAGYELVLGHARHPASCALNVSFGAKLGARHPNWYGTGQLYRFYELRLQ